MRMTHLVKLVTCLLHEDGQFYRKVKYSMRKTGTNCYHPCAHHEFSSVGAPGDNDSIDPLTDAVVDVLGKDSPILEGIAGTRDMDHE